MRKPTRRQVLVRIAKLKEAPFGSVWIEGTIRSTPFALQLLSRDTPADARIVRLLARWRKKHEVWYLSQFPVTVARTRRWLMRQVLDTPDRLLFLIDVRGTYMGHVGLFRFDFHKKTCEIDNIVRGRAGYPGLMAEGVAAMMHWGRKKLGLQGFTLQTTSDNRKAIALYRRLGFVQTRRVALMYKKTPDGGKWVPAPKGYSKPIVRFDVYMRLEREYEAK